MANNDFQNGYDAAIEAIKKVLSGQQSGDQNNSSGQSSDGRDMDLNGTPAGDKMQSQGQQPNLPNDSGSGDDQNGQGGQSGDQSQEDQNGQGGQGQVTAADCAGQFGDDIPSTPGGFMDPKQGNELAEQEGYDKGPNSAESNSKSWKEVALNAAKSQKAGSSAGSLISKIIGIWKVATDWKKTFKKIIGKSLNTQDKRIAWANKNALVSQNRLARTEKDKYDVVDYIIAFIDASGSMSDDDLKYVLSEVYQMASQMKPIQLAVVQFDTRIADVQIFNNPGEFKKYTKTAGIKGRGGTNCRCCWDLLKDDKRFKGKRTELAIIFTDGWLDQIKRDPKTMNNLCWAILDNGGWNCVNKDAHTMTIYLDTSKIR